MSHNLPPNVDGKNAIIIYGARQHNLRNLTFAVPKHSIVVFTGPSGSGKSSIAFDTIYAEGQRRYIDSMSVYARQFMANTPKPDIDRLEGLSPTISIEQKTTTSNLRSTVGTVTEVYDYVRVLWAQMGLQHCHKCNAPVTSSNKEQIIERILELPEGTKFMILAPQIRNRKGEYRELLENLRKQGFTRARIDGKESRLEDVDSLRLNVKHDIDVVVDRLVAKKSDASSDIISRLTDSVARALDLGNGELIVLIPKHKGKDDEVLYSIRNTCPNCEIAFPELTHQSFSFNSRIGWCPKCKGTGVVDVLQQNRFVANQEESLADGVVVPLGPKPKGRGWKTFPLANDTKPLWRELRSFIETLGLDYEATIDLPWKDLPLAIQDGILNGNREFSGVKKFMALMLKVAKNPKTSTATSGFIESFFDETACPKCGGHRLRAESQAVEFHGIFINEINDLQVDQLIERLDAVTLTEREDRIGGDLVREIQDRLHFLCNVGLSYLSLGRGAGTLSGGESQRIRLASQLGANISGIMYVLDEPSIGLHQRDNERLLDTLKQLRDRGNSVLVVEHDRETMEAADYIVDFGPGGGSRGGYLIAQGTYEEIVKNKDSITAAYLSGRREIEAPAKRRRNDGAALVIRGARANNLKSVDVRIPARTFTCVTGVSGTGKSTLVHSIVYPALARELYYKRRLVGEHDSIEGLDLFDKVIEIDQTPIGRTPRSNPATYTKVFDEIRKLYAELPDAKMYGFKMGRFSFNTAGGRCEECNGAGRIKVELGFLANTYVLCERCLGKRYNHTTLLIEYRGKNIAEVLEMTVAEAAEFFKAHPKISAVLETLLAVGLDYIQLGQPSTLLSGGEAQRIKLSRELAKRATGKTLYILDEPSTGLHFDDIRKLLEVVHRLVDEGNSVLMIEHNLDIIRSADYIIDMGPEGGDKGGYIVATGTPEEVMENRESITGRYLRRESNKE